MAPFAGGPQSFLLPCQSTSLGSMNDREEVGQLLEAYRTGDLTWTELTGELLRLATPNLGEFLSAIPQTVPRCGGRKLA